MLRLNKSTITSFFKRKKESHEFFLTLHIKPFSIGAILLEKKDKHLVISASFESALSQHVDSLPPQELLEYADKAISSIENSVEHGNEVEKTIFALPNHWVEDARVKREHLQVLKKITDDLALVPIGFLISTEAVIHELVKKEGAPLSAILIEIINEQLFLSLVKQGKILEEDRATIQESSIATVELLLHGLRNAEVLPSRIILIDNAKDSKEQQSFISHVWSKSIPFLHIPQVEVLDKLFEQECVIQGVGDQLGLEVQLDELLGSVVEQNETAEVEVGEDFGFVKEKDLFQMKKEEVHEESDVVPVEEESDPSVSHHSEHDAHSDEMVKGEKVELDIEEKSTHHVSRGVGKKALPTLNISILSSFFTAPKMLLKRPGLVTLPIAGIGIVILAWFVYTNYIVRTKVTIFARVEEIKVDETITLAEEGEVGEGILPLKKFQEEEEGEVSIPTTGEKDTGEKAKGEITVFNKTEKEKSFPKGTVLVGTNKLEFVTSDDVSVASTAAFSTEFTSKKVKVEAKVFGKEYNLPSKTNLEFKEFPAASYFAKNDVAFAGGTKKTSQVASEEDLESLESELIKSLSQKARESVQSKLSPSQTLIESPLESEMSGSEYSNEEGDEVKEISLSGKVLITLGAYDQQDMTQLVKNLNETNIPSEYEIDKSHTSLALEDISVDDGVQATLLGTAVFQPKIEVEKIKDEIRGKTISGTQKKLSELGGIGDVRINQNITIPFLGTFISRNPDHILIEVRAE